MAISNLATILNGIEQEDIETSVFHMMIKNSQKRYKDAGYVDIAIGDAAFQTSAQALLDWATIIDDFKRNDALIVRNSIHIR